jgi:catechol 2,3-dioxygenase
MSGENQASHSIERHVRLAHLGLLVRDVARMQAFYTTVLGLGVSDRGVSERRGQEMTFMTGDPAVHHHLVLVGAGHAAMEGRRLDHLAFDVATLADLRAVRDRASAAGAEIRAADHGNAWSIYFADPEGNRVEVLAVSPNVASQPRGRPLDLDQPDACIEAETRRHLAGT